MPVRHFSGAELRTLRRAADITQAELARRVGVSVPQVPKWEAGASFPSLEKLPAIAAGLGRPLDEVFPRTGDPDLLDLRCDAGLTQVEAAALLGTSHVPVSNAERGRRRLDPRYVPLLAKEYHVTEKDLLVAQDRSFGIASAASPARPSLPETLAGRITFLLGSRFAADEVPDDADITGRINAAAGRQLLSAAEFAALRSGESELADLLGGAADRVVFLDGLGEVLGVSPMVFQSDDVVARQVVEGIQRLAASGQGFAMAARGAEEMGVSPQMLAALAAVLEQAERDRPGPQPN